MSCVRTQRDISADAPTVARGKLENKLFCSPWTMPTRLGYLAPPRLRQDPPQTGALSARSDAGNSCSGRPPCVGGSFAFRHGGWANLFFWLPARECLVDSRPPPPPPWPTSTPEPRATDCCGRDRMGLPVDCACTLRPCAGERSSGVRRRRRVGGGGGATGWTAGRH